MPLYRSLPKPIAKSLNSKPTSMRAPRPRSAGSRQGIFLNHPDVELKIPGALRETAPLVASGSIRVPIAATYPLTDFREAVAHVQRGGKVLFDVDGAI